MNRPNAKHIAQGVVMLGIVSSIIGTVDAVTTYVAERLPARVETIELGAGFLLIGGLALIGSALPVVL